MSAAAFIAYLATIPAANWMIGHVGSCIPQGPCLLPVGFGLMAPSGVLMIGAALVLRDVVHERLGGWFALAAVLAGAAISGFVAPGPLVLASVVSFGLSELADLAVYAPLRKRRLYAAVLLSGVAGAAVDSVVFLWLAFGSLDFLTGQIVGKLWMTLAALPVLQAVRWRAA
jgi:uncharacterized PurR-regulated membrane protein YhhQ (DUF165 family)